MCSRLLQVEKAPIDGPNAMKLREQLHQFHICAANPMSQSQAGNMMTIAAYELNHADSFLNLELVM